MFKATCNWKTVVDVLGGKHIEELTLYITSSCDKYDGYEDDGYSDKFEDCKIQDCYTAVNFLYVDEKKGRCIDLYPGWNFFAGFDNPELSKPDLVVEAFCRIRPDLYFVSIRHKRDGHLGMVIKLKEPI